MLHSRRTMSNVSTSLFSSEISDYYATTTTPVAGDGVLSTQDIIVGTILAFILAFGYSYLNGQSSTTTFVSWGNQIMKDYDDKNVKMRNDTGREDVVMSKMDDRTFNGNDWMEISREENYVLYNTRIRQKISSSDRKKEDVGSVKRTARNSVGENDRYDEKNDDKNFEYGNENKAVVIALMALFLPIFTVEIFFALSRQILCEMGGGIDHGGLAQKLCSPINNFVR
ncbi:hypothetical protein ACHAXS_001266 [Conticribra weissflogii]